MATKKRTKKQTLSEFQAWLEGVEELQPEGWCPDATQWVLIRDKMNSIVEPKETVRADALQKILEKMIGKPVGGNIQPTPQPSNQLQPRQPSYIPPPAPLSGGFPDGPIEVAPAAKAYVNLPPAPTIDIDAVAKPKDSADGKYSSSFT